MDVSPQGVAPDRLSSIFTNMSPEPVASASIGQVYKATLNDGREVCGCRGHRRVGTSLSSAGELETIWNSLMLLEFEP